MQRPWRALGAAVVLAGSLVSVGALAAEPATAQQSPEPEAWIIVDADTGEVLDAHNEHAALRPASTTKIMTALVAVERLDPNEPVVISETAAAQPPSKVGAEVGEEWELETAIAGILLSSANDLAYALAEEAGDGDLDTWVDVVNATADRYGMEDSTFNDPAGFDAPGETLGAGPVVSAYDIAIATRNALAVPALAALAASSEYEFAWPGTDNTVLLENHNKLLPGGDRAYDGATGFKTGYTSAAGHTFVGTAERAGRELIVVVMDTYDFYGWAQLLLDQGFATPSGEGAGSTLPDIAIEPYAARQSDLMGFVAAARGSAPEIDVADETTSATVTADSGSDGDSDAESDAASSADETTDDATSNLAGASVDDPSASEVTEAGDGTDADSDAGSATQGSGLPTTTIVAILIVVAAAAFFARRRQIQTRKRRRMHRRRVTAQAIRRGTLPVADGRPLVHGRASSPPAVEAKDSHVRLVPRGEPDGRPR